MLVCHPRERLVDDWFFHLSLKIHDTQAPGAEGLMIMITDHRSKHYTYLKEPVPGSATISPSRLSLESRARVLGFLRADWRRSATPALSSCACFGVQRNPQPCFGVVTGIMGHSDFN